MGILTNLIRRSLENPSTPLSAPDDWLFDSLGSFRASSGVNVNRETALTYDAYWRCIGLISGDVSKLPLCVKEIVGKGKVHATSHPAYPLLRYKSSAEMMAMQMKRVITFHAMSEGNGYAYIQRDKSGRPLELWPMNPMKTYPLRHNQELWYVTQVGDTERKIPGVDVFHLKGLSFDGLVGYAAVAKMRECLGMGIAAENFGSTFFRNNARPNVILKSPKKLSPEAKINLRESWERIHSGLENAHRTAVLEDGMDLTPLMHNARDSQLLELKAFTRVQVCNFFGVPPHKVGDNSRTSYNSLEQENQSYIEDGGGLGYWLAAWQAECWDKLLSDEEKAEQKFVVEFNLRELLRANVQVRTSYYTQLMDRGVLSANEVRAEEGFNPREGGDDYRVMLNTKDAATPDADPNAAPKPDAPPAPGVGSGKDKKDALPPLLELRSGRKPKRSVVDALAILAAIPDSEDDDAGDGEISVLMPVQLNPPANPSKQDLAGAKKKTVRISTLVATQPRVKRDLVEDHIKDPNHSKNDNTGSTHGVGAGVTMPTGLPADMPYIVKAGGVRYIWDGHHRLTSEQLLGVDRLDVYYLKV